MAAPKTKSPTASAELDRQIAVLDRRGWDQWDIAAEVGISQPMVSIRLKKIRTSYHREIVKERESAKDEKVAQLRDIRKEAWAAYFRSMKDAEKLVEEYGTVNEQVGFDDYVTSEALIKKIKTTEGRLPDNAYLNTIMKTLDAERELLGLDQMKPDVVPLTEVLGLISTFRDAARDVLQSHPELLIALMQRTGALAPQVTAKVIVNANS